MRIFFWNSHWSPQTQDCPSAQPMWNPGDSDQSWFILWDYKNFQFSSEILLIFMSLYQEKLWNVFLVYINVFSKSYKKLYRYIISTPQYIISLKRKFLHSEKLTLCYKGQTSESIICHKKNPVEKKWADQPDLLGHEMFWNKSRKTYHDLPSLILWAQTYSFKVDVKELEVI